jgi:Na+-transporting methylmalonyl-CoA/oxaloacetate decarboxylase gamma subunit
MDDPLVIALVVSGIGMVLLFVALAILYGLMYLMTAVIKDRAEGETQPANAQRKRPDRGQGAESRKRRAAAIAVALARAELESSPAGGSGAEAPPQVSAWRAYHHQRRLALNQRTRRGS